MAAEAKDSMVEMGQEAEWRKTEDLGKEGRKTEIRRWAREADINGWKRCN